MKLFNGKQVNRMIGRAKIFDGDVAENFVFILSEEDILSSEKPIEQLNFDKLWDEFRSEHPNTVGGFKEQYECFIWLKEQILNQNK